MDWRAPRLPIGADSKHQELPGNGWFAHCFRKFDELIREGQWNPLLRQRNRPEYASVAIQEGRLYSEVNH